MHIVIYGIIVLFEVIFYRQADLFWNSISLKNTMELQRELQCLLLFSHHFERITSTTQDGL